ncbi:hypothetical protein BDM02DRAFT_3104989 [Thelephora ganbajun]|uniref:Uncharacterized protein n=1 Tax=Thelephora ganbajun TaxID=370292 RepID=A0ACB6YZW7_THEGA|nr:hypothetical protein BDM02DRAFT_3104989 [Thelephora ganbajun]
MKVLDVFNTTRVPSKFFRSTPRELYGRVVQTVTGHGYTGEYYTEMSLDQSPWCPCSTDGAPIHQTCLHILRECRRYNAHRHTLSQAIPDLFDPS